MPQALAPRPLFLEENFRIPIAGTLRRNTVAKRVMGLLQQRKCLQDWTLAFRMILIPKTPNH